MGADAAAGRCVAHHHVVEPGVRNECELAQQLFSGRQAWLMPVPGATTCPRICRQRSCGKRPVPHLPSATVADDEPRFQVVAFRQREELVPLQEVPEPGQCIAGEQRAFLPVPTEKLRGCQAGKTDFRHAKQS